MFRFSRNSQTIFQITRLFCMSHQQSMRGSAFLYLGLHVILKFILAILRDGVLISPCGHNLVSLVASDA